MTFNRRSFSLKLLRKDDLYQKDQQTDNEEF